jgi:hypothetical protein
MWIELHQSVFTHRKTLALADLLDIPPVHLVGHLCALWQWSLDNAPTGDLKTTSYRVIALASHWRDNPENFVDGLVSVGFLDRHDHLLAIHNWDKYTGKLFDRKARNAQQMREAREREKAQREASLHHVDNTSETRGNTQEHSVEPVESRVQHVSNTSTTRVNNVASRVNLPDLTGPNLTGPDQKNVISAEITGAGAPTSVGVREYWEAKVRESKNRQGVLGNMYETLFGKKVDRDRMGLIVKEAKAASIVLDAILQTLSAPSRVDDPLDYIHSIVKRRLHPEIVPPIRLTGRAVDAQARDTNGKVDYTLSPEQIALNKRNNDRALRERAAIAARKEQEHAPPSTTPNGIAADHPHA